MFDIEKILISKRDLRQKLTALPIAEKLALLDALRERNLALNPSPEHDGSASAANKAATPIR